MKPTDDMFKTHQKQTTIPERVRNNVKGIY